MDVNGATDLVREAVTLVILLSAPVLGTGLLVALIVSVLQGITQVHEQTLSFVPKIIAMLLALVVFGPWMIERVLEFSREMFGTLP